MTDPLSFARREFGKQLRKARIKTAPNLTELALRQRRSTRGRSPPKDGLSQAELARRLSVNQSQIANIERGTENLSFDYACRLAEAVGGTFKAMLCIPLKTPSTAE